MDFILDDDDEQGIFLENQLIDDDIQNLQGKDLDECALEITCFLCCYVLSIL